MPGLTTLIIISSLLCVVAVWTWAIDAEASGLSSKDLNLARDAAKSVEASTPLGKAALDIFSKFCEDGDSETDYSGISKMIGGDAWDYPFDPKGKD